MRLIPLDDEFTHKHYKQNGNGTIPIFSGDKYQTGFGLGSIFGSILKAALPVVKEGVKSLGKTAVKTGLNIARDSLSGKSIKDSLSDNLDNAKGEVLSKARKYVGNKVRANQNVYNSKRNINRKRSNKSVTSKKPMKHKRRKIRRDIFD